MRIFLTGATGYIGWHVANALRRAGHRVLGLVRNPNQTDRLWAREIEPVVGSMDDPSSYRDRLADCGAVVHAAVDYTGDTFGLDQRTVETILAARPARFVYTSGVWVYGNTGREAVDESSPTNPPVRVARRLDSERLALSTPVPTLVLRPGCVYGQEGGMFADWMAPIAGGESPTIIGDGRNRWTLVNVDDLAAAYVRAVESPVSGEIVNLTDRSRATVAEMVEAIAQAAGFRGAIRYQSVADPRQTLGSYAECLALDQHVDSSKAVRLLGWQPRHGGFADQAALYYAAWRARNSSSSPSRS